jgi:hypothetical protein
MKTSRLAPVLALAPLFAAACGDDTTADPAACVPADDSPRTIAEAKLYFEYNATDDDTGIHGMFDDAGWSELCVYAPDGTQVLVTRPLGALGEQTLGGIFFESREPPSSQVPHEDVLARFPEGMYQVVGTTFDGASLAGAALLSHDIAAPPVITGPADGVVVDPADLVVTWDPVTETVAGDPVTITGYEVIVTNEDKDGADPHGMSQPIASIHVVPTVSSLTIPAEFLEPGTEYELELIAIEESGNQTITVQFFDTP